MSLYICKSPCVLYPRRPEEALDSLLLELHAVVTTWQESWELYSSSLQERQVLMTAEPAHQFQNISYSSYENIKQYKHVEGKLFTNLF